MGPRALLPVPPLVSAHSSVAVSFGVSLECAVLPRRGLHCCADTRRWEHHAASRKHLAVLQLQMDHCLAEQQYSLDLAGAVDGWPVID